MADQNQWRNDERSRQGEDSRDWRSAGDQWRRNEQFSRGEQRGRRYGPGAGDYESDRDYPSSANPDEFGRGYGEDDWRRDNRFARPDYPRYGSWEEGRPGGIYGPGTYGAGWGSGPYDRDIYRDDYRYGSPRYGRVYAGERRSRGDQRGFWDRATDEIASWFGDRDAERRRQRDWYRGYGPKGYTRSDERILEDVNERLTDDPFVDASNIETSVTNREVTLAGTVSSRDQRRRAEDCAESVSGVMHVQNNIRVASPSLPDTESRSIGQTAFGRDASGTTTTTGVPDASGPH